jgi:glucose-1-phosphate adenylyltransferase
MEKRDPRTVVAVILGGGAGTRLFPLTKRRAKPAVSLSLNHIFHRHRLHVY